MAAAESSRTGGSGAAWTGASSGTAPVAATIEPGSGSSLPLFGAAETDVAGVCPGTVGWLEGLGEVMTSNAASRAEGAGLGSTLAAAIDLQRRDAVFVYVRNGVQRDRRRHIMNRDRRRVIARLRIIIGDRHANRAHVADRARGR